MKPHLLRRDLAIELELAGHKVLREHGSVEASCLSLWPLGGALVEGARLFSLLDSSATANDVLCSLFDGGEGRGPNIDTRLKCIRDLCSASAFALRARSLGSADEVRCAQPVETPGERYWANLISGAGGSGDEKSIIEVSHLLDDVLEEMVCVARSLRELSSASCDPVWGEVYRAACHIRDHFDYAEDNVIACIRPAVEER